MPVYVDRLVSWPKTKKWPYPSACHMVADTLEELHETAREIGLPRRYFQDCPPSSCPHYDLTASMRARAIGAGAVDGDLLNNRVDYHNCVRWAKLVAHAKHLRSKGKK